MNRAKILVVDDEEDILETLRFRLEQEGYEIITATNGFEGLGAAKIVNPDLVILDVMLPRENGYRVSHMIRDGERTDPHSKRIPILLLTARNLSSDAEREKMFMNFSEADEVIYKPFEMDRLVRRIEELLGSAEETVQQD